VIFHSFDPVVVRLSLDSTNIQHEKLVFQLLKPFIEGFSVASLNDVMETEPSQEPTKRKSKDGDGVKNQKKKKN
jgi:exosome complex exonuclease DIS3/RRP44